MCGIKLLHVSVVFCLLYCTTFIKCVTNRMTLIKMIKCKEYLFKLFKTKLVSPQLILIMFFFNFEDKIKTLNFQIKFSFITAVYEHKTDKVLPCFFIIEHLNAFYFVSCCNPLEYFIRMHLWLVNLSPVESSFLEANITFC